MIKDYCKNPNDQMNKTSFNSSTSLLLGDDDDFYSNFGGAESSDLGWESWSNFASNGTFSDSSIAPPPLQSSFKQKDIQLEQNSISQYKQNDLDNSFLDFDTNCPSSNRSSVEGENPFNHLQNIPHSMLGSNNNSTMKNYSLQSQLNHLPYNSLVSNSPSKSEYKKPLNLFESLQRTQESQQMMHRNFLFNGGSPLMHAQMGSASPVMSHMSPYFNPYDQYQQQMMMMHQSADNYKRARMSQSYGLGIGNGGMSHHPQQQHHHPMMMMNLPPTKVPLTKQQYTLPSSSSSSAYSNLSSSSSSSSIGKETSQPLILPSALTSIKSYKRSLKDSIEDLEDNDDCCDNEKSKGRSGTIEETLNQFLKDTADISSSTSTVANLKSILRKYALNATGKKEDLFARINLIRDHYLIPSLKRRTGDDRIKNIINSATASPDSPALSQIPSNSRGENVKGRKEYDGDHFFVENLVLGSRNEGGNTI